jgi:hypothetical protein
MAPLPNPPFSLIGLDYAAPFYVKAKLGNEKAYIFILTCMATRGMHLYLTPDMSTDRFL